MEKELDLALEALLDIKEKEFLKKNSNVIYPGLRGYTDVAHRITKFAFRMGFKEATNFGKDLNEEDQNLYNSIKEKQKEWKKIADEVDKIGRG